MDLNITINLDNSAFDDEEFDIELARIFRQLATQVLGTGIQVNIKDINGNTVGRATYLN